MRRYEHLWKNRLSIIQTIILINKEEIVFNFWDSFIKHRKIICFSIIIHTVEFTVTQDSITSLLGDFSVHLCSCSSLRFRILMGFAVVLLKVIWGRRRRSSLMSWTFLFLSGLRFGGKNSNSRRNFVLFLCISFVLKILRLLSLLLVVLSSFSGFILLCIVLWLALCTSSLLIGPLQIFNIFNSSHRCRISFFYWDLSTLIMKSINVFSSFVVWFDYLLRVLLCLNLANFNLLCFSSWLFLSNGLFRLELLFSTTFILFISHCLIDLSRVTSLFNLGFCTCRGTSSLLILF